MDKSKNNFILKMEWQRGSSGGTEKEKDGKRDKREKVEREERKTDENFFLKDKKK